MNGPAKREALIFTEALGVPVEKRAAFLEGACGGDDRLRRKVEALLKSYEEVGDFLEEAPDEAVAEARIAAAFADEKPAERIGRYKLLQQIGEGGCGVVFMAEQEEPVRRRVALKIIKPGMDTKSVIARFETERQALAMMDHPSIAKVFDAGATESGRPYFVMELVRGVKITEYCDEHSLTTEERLKLFIQVCAAIQHAHQKGIIHRDIKPSNILVTMTSEGLPLPVVIDFGIAKPTTNQRLTDKTLFTAFEMFIGTPAYVSPEQAAMTNTDVDTRSDIYSLGVLLYELLTGSTPFDTVELLKDGIDAIRNVIREREPVRPSTRLSKLGSAALTTVAQRRQSEPPKLIRTIRGDLDWIVMKALEKDRARRYPTANGLAMDIERYLGDEAVLARPPSATYKARKLVARNKLLFSGIAVIFVFLVISLITTTRWLMLERGAREQLRRRIEIARIDEAGWELFYARRYDEAEPLLMRSLALRKQLPESELAAPILHYQLILQAHVVRQKYDRIRPFLQEFADPVTLSRGAFRPRFESAIGTLGGHGRWDDAVALAEWIREALPNEPSSYHLEVPLLVKKNNVEKYRLLCREILARFSHTTNYNVADQMAKDCLILPSSGVDLNAVAALADMAVTRGSNDAAAPYFKCCKALAEFRLGHYEEAAKWAQLAHRGGYPDVEAEGAAIIAMSQFKLKQLDQAQIALADCNKVIESKMPTLEKGLGDSWRDWIIAQALQSEAKQMIEAPEKHASKEN